MVRPSNPLFVGKVLGIGTQPEESNAGMDSLSRELDVHPLVLTQPMQAGRRTKAMKIEGIRVAAWIEAAVGMVL